MKVSSISLPKSASDVYDIESILFKMDVDELAMKYKLIFAYWIYLVFVLTYNTQILGYTYIS